jgi:hypothetical protein
MIACLNLSKKGEGEGGKEEGNGQGTEVVIVMRR